jgi:cobalamin biosynthesis protein CobW
VIELANGCICCTVADDFVPTMKKLLDRRIRPQHIVIETSGLALPQPLVRAFNWPEIKSRVTVDGVVTVVDAKALAEGRFADDEEAVQAQREADPNLDHENPIEELFEDQLNCADMVIVNKTDLLDAHEHAGVNEELKSKVRAGTRLVPTRHGRSTSPPCWASAPRQKMTWRTASPTTRWKARSSMTTMIS